MATPFSEIDGIFLKKVERDRRFVEYFNLSDIENIELVIKQCDGFREEAVIYFLINTEVSPALMECDYDKREFTEDLTVSEKGILANLMFQFYYERNLAKLRGYENDFTPTDLKTFSIAEKIRATNEVVSSVREANDALINSYSVKDRLTNQRIGVDYASYDTDE